MGTLRLRHARRADLPTIVEIWVDAFSDDPYFRWIEPRDERWLAFGTAWLSFIAQLTFERGHTLIAEPADVAIAWVPPDIELVDADAVERARGIIVEHAGEARAEEALRTIVAARAHLLEEPHWTLQYIGVRGATQGRGLGAAAAAPGLARCDDEALPCSLISTNPKNVPFYARQGFEVAAEISTPDGVATLRPMHRAPRTPFTD
jgi:GNAT superfamily N-acetyltransferase